MEENQVLTKKCPKCGRVLPVESFNRCNATKDGLQIHCRECQKVFRMKRRQSQIGMHKVYSKPDLAKFQPRELIAELKARGYSGELSFTQRITV